MTGGVQLVDVDKEYKRVWWEKKEESGDESGRRGKDVCSNLVTTPPIGTGFLPNQETIIWGDESIGTGALPNQDSVVREEESDDKVLIGEVQEGQEVQEIWKGQEIPKGQEGREGQKVSRKRRLFNNVLWGDESDDKGLVGEVEEVREVQEGQEIKEGQEGLRETEKNLVGISSLSHL